MCTNQCHRVFTQLQLTNISINQCFIITLQANTTSTQHYVQTALYYYAQPEITKPVHYQAQTVLCYHAQTVHIIMTNKYTITYNQ
jgi:hypothetical protein